jgi:hypothetical protein
MSTLCFLLDENVPLVIQTQLAQMEPLLSVHAKGPSYLVPFSLLELMGFSLTDNINSRRDLLHHLHHCGMAARFYQPTLF